MVIFHFGNCSEVKGRVEKSRDDWTWQLLQASKMWKFLGRKFGRGSSGAGVASSTGGSVIDLKGKYSLEKVCKMLLS